MSSCNFSSILFIAAVVIYTFAVLTLFKDDNPVRLVSDYLYDLDHLDYLLHPRLSRHSVEAIYQFGDSLSDTGNFKVENPYSSFSQSPYGVTYFHKSTGRCSDGLLMIDYLAEFLNLPFVEPYLNKDGNFMHGANFAVVGATALDTSTLQAKDIMPSFTNSSLFVQLEWFKTHLTSICSNTSECKSKLSKALFIVGEIGGNDYNFAISRGSIPNDSIFYDETKCIKILNDFAKFHNDQLHQAIRQLQLNHPDIAIVYMDLAKGMKKILHHPTSFGFDKNNIYRTCCGGHDDHNFNSSKLCGMYGVKACRHPEKYVNWDGYHLTSHAYKVITRRFISKSFYDFSAVS
ncbi:GDSL esterase/lipase At1g28670-like isoform X2 [Silene latifolia]|uniref:GDSL esterase/lipase At1g28670-like isoform X2 n=1 Tax=Silene latifolia TaxID=37657 RepID=UPI003D76AD5D